MRSKVHGRKSVSELPANVGTSDGRNFRRSSGLPTCTVEQTVNTTDAGTPGLGQVSVGTPNKRRDFRRSGLPTIVGTSDGHRQQVSRTIDAGTPGLGRDFRLSGLLTHIGTSDVHSHRVGCNWESALPARVMTSDCREFWLTSRLPTPIVIENYSMCT